MVCKATGEIIRLFFCRKIVRKSAGKTQEERCYFCYYNSKRNGDREKGISTGLCNIFGTGEIILKLYPG